MVTLSPASVGLLDPLDRIEAGFDALGEVDLFLGVEQCDLADLLQVGADGVSGGRQFGILAGLLEGLGLFLVVPGELFGFGLRSGRSRLGLLGGLLVDGLVFLGVGLDGADLDDLGLQAFHLDDLDLDERGRVDVDDVEGLDRVVGDLWGHDGRGSLRGGRLGPRRFRAVGPGLAGGPLGRCGLGGGSCGTRRGENRSLDTLLAVPVFRSFGVDVRRGSCCACH